MEKKHTRWNISKALEALCQSCPKCADKLSNFQRNKKWKPNERQQLLLTVSELFLQAECTASICCYLQPLILDIVERIRSSLSAADKPSRSQLLKFTLALSVTARICPDIKGFTLNFINEHKPLTNHKDDLASSEPKKKRSKLEKISEISLCRGIWCLLRVFKQDIKESIDTSHMMHNLSSSNKDVRWFSALSVCELLTMSSYEQELFLRKYFSVEEEHELIIRDFTEEQEFKSKYQKIGNLIETDEVVKKEANRTYQQILGTDLSCNVTEVCGVLLSKLSSDEQSVYDSGLVGVPSMLNNLRSLALAVASGNPVLLQGAVGSGKTSIVEHLAHLTGRHSSPQIMKIQLGDQTDSKALLGIYRCTEIPGEFIWQPGILTQAVLEGYWVLLEDIDYAPMDVVSVLLPLLENHTLSVPGHGDNIQASPNFRLFASQRLISSTSGWQKQQAGSSVLLEKMWTKIHIEPLSRSELAQVILSKYPILESIVNRILDVYFLLSAGKHDIDITTDSLEIDTSGKFLSLDGRLISTRDLMSWCSRISKDFDVKSTNVASRVYQEACDCFVSCISKPDKRLAVAEAIGAKLNITKDQAEYYCKRYKPEISITSQDILVGRVNLPKHQTSHTQLTRSYSTFSFTRQCVSLLEKVGVCIVRNEPVLLVGETGTGKTSSVQFLSQQLGHKLHVVNMNQQSDSTDLLGGFKPVDIKFLIMPFREEFEMLFCKSFSRKQNAKFLGHLQDCFSRRKWTDLLKLIEHTTNRAVTKFENDNDLLAEWKVIERRQKQLKIQIKETENVLAFSFIEGTLVKAIKEGHWVLLDEINLASAETLECLCGLLESQNGSIILTERGDIEPIIRHENFRLFACMNPATDVGKKDLTPGIRNRFTEFYVEELTDENDLRILTSDYLSGLALTANHISGIVKFYSTVRNTADKSLVDGTGHKPHYSLRTLCRALRYAASNPCGQSSRSLYEGFCLSFLTQLDRISHPVVEQLVCKHVIGNSNLKSMLNHSLQCPRGGRYLQFEGYWISQGSLEPTVPDGYILTPSVRANLKDLSRIVSAGEHPVLLQGETSVGKTSLITWLAKSTGNVCVRVNNHEHTDLQEYVGCYAADESGKLIFKEGVLVEAMRKGHWIILDELNLAPSDVLEALNRLLDDNRELFIPETQVTVKAHPKFMLFATQNPAGQYGGRKILSRAFRNRFIELHFDEIPSGELETILHLRCSIPQSYSKRLVAVMLDLQTRRRSSGVFAGKQGFMTLRDLFRWAERYNSPDDVPTNKYYDWDQHLADHGYMLLAGRVRKPDECQVIQDVLSKHFKRKVNPERLFNRNSETSSTTASLLDTALNQSLTGFQHIVWTYSMRRLAVLIGQALKFKEPVLLVGETGCGKTTICQLYAELKGHSLYSVNCHLHTESADFLGGLRPVRSHSSDDDSQDKLFEWVDGPLVQAMKESAMFLIDEISLADDSVLERLNSVLEPERRLLLAEKGGGDGYQNESEDITAGDDFRVFATMNPGGDFGKKELSPALRNRFTEIWCPPCIILDDMISIIEHNLEHGLYLSNQQDNTSGIGPAIMDFIHWFSNNEIGKRCTVSIRDILSWVNFINICSIKDDDDDISDSGYLPVPISYIHGASLVFLDSLGSGHTSSGGEFSPAVAKETCIEYLIQQIKQLTNTVYTLDDLGFSHKQLDILQTDTSFTIPPFTITKGPLKESKYEKYALKAPTTSLNALRILRGLQLSRPLLLEGSPGVGKTSLVTAIARQSGRQLVRINLSEQTDVTDLFGADLPVEGEKGGTFAWRDGPLLQALKSGHWVVLDELNLASQSVLEGLNACLDHRGEVYIPELSKTFHIKQDETRIFGCQNPLHQGGGRKGLPRSFLNRFTQVFVEPLEREDLLFISQSMYPTIPNTLLFKMVNFNMTIYEETVEKRLWGGKGGPWEFNLRDLFRWCDLLLTNQVEDNYKPGEYLTLIYSDRMRTIADKQRVIELFERCFEDERVYQSSRYISINQDQVQVGHSFLPRVKTQTSTSSSSLKILHHNLQPLESIMKCVEMNWMAILVGPQASGKTSIIRLLADLTGQQLHVLPMNSSMDTTELLGGFEQADISRHVEEISNDVNILLEKYQRAICINKHTMTTGSVQKLHQLWSHYTQLSLAGKGASSLEEHRLLIKRIQSLKHILQCLPNIVDVDLNGEIEILSGRLEKTNQSVIQTEPGRGGGAFEWIDSLLVKALISGHWLLIDNVNFCSASVLDRLNALLEPGGVLSVNERGVIDGQIPTIKPHPNFRLFLAMDSRYGEISRAMRNRGVEIYISGEVDGCAYSRLDILSMLEGIGLHHYSIKQWLISVHDSVKQDLPYTEKPTITDLLRCGVVVKQQLDKGMPLIQSLQQAAHDVYLRSLKFNSSKKIAAEIIQNSCIGFNISLAVEDSQRDLVPLVWPGTSELNENISLFNTCQASGVLSHFINKYITLQNFHHQPNIDEINTTIHEITTAFKIFLSNTSHNSMKFNQTWLEVFVRHLNLPEDQVQGEFGFSVSKFISLLPVLYSKCSQLMFNGTVNRQYLHLIEKLATKEGMNILLEESWDMENNKQIMDKIRLQHPDIQNFNTETVTMDNILHRFYMLMDVGLVLSKCTKWLTFLEDQSVKVSTLPSSSLYVLVHVHNFCNNLENVLTSVLMDMESNVQISWFWNNLPYMVYFLSVVKNLKSYPESVFLSRLSLHWNWLYNKLLVPLLSSSSTWRPPSVILSSINQLQNIMGQENMAAKQFVKYLTQYGHPKPYTTQSRSDLQQDIRYCQDCFNIHKHNKPAVLKLKVEALVNDGENLKCLLQSICESFYNGDSDQENEDDIQMKIGKLKFSLIEKNILEEEFEAMDTSESADTPATVAKSTSLKQYVELWPIYEHFSLLLEYYLMASDKPQLNVQHLRDLIIRYTPATTVHLLDNLDTMDKKKLYLILSEMIMNKLWRSTVTKDSTTWLLWNTQLSPPDDDTKTRYRGPGILHLIPMSYSIYTLLSTKSPDPKDNSYLPLHVSLGSVDDQLKKLHQLSSYLWKYSGVLSSTRLNIGNIEEAHLMKSFIKMLDSFGVLLTSHSQTKWFDLISTVEINYSTQTLTTEDILTVQAFYQEVYTTIEHPALPLISRCFEVVIDILQDNMGSGLGLGLAYVGLASVFLLAPVGPVDPVEKNAIKMKNFENQVKEIECEIEVYDSNIRLKTGLTIGDIETSKLHPRLQYLIDRKQHLQHKILLLTNQQAYRPDPLQYLSLVQDVKAYLESIGSIERVTSLLSKLQTAYQVEGAPHVDKVIYTSCLREEEAWQQTQQSFLDSLEEHYWCYPDLISPFKVLIQQMRLGVSILAQRVETSHKQFILSKQIYGQSLEEVMLILSQFPNISENHETFHDLTKILIYDTTCELVNTSISTNTDSDHIHDVLSKLLLCGLYLIKIHCINSGELTSHITQTLSNLFTTFVTAWQDQETRRREKEAEEASLYRYRSKTHGDEKTDEDKDEAEFKSSFPSFENEYADLVGPQTLEEVGNITEEECIKSTPYSISIEDMYTVYKIHDLLFTSLTTTDWLPSVPYTKPTVHDYIQPAVIAYNIASQVATKSPDALGREVDTGVVGGHLLISGVVQQTILSGLNNTQTQTENSLCLKPTEYYDIYYDSNVNEVSQCKVILDRFINRLDELLTEYPQHPTLSQIVAIIRRILSFSITCPIMKFLVGLELLLEKTKDWEANASKHVSVMTHFKEVSAMVVQWRKLELGCWKNTMLIEERKCEKSVSKWWFHLYQLITSYLHNDSNSQETVDNEKLVTSLKEFLEKSHLGEFKYRLKMILAFHCQVYKMDASNKQVEVLNLLWNLHQFYLQYLPNIEAEISSQKIPLQKQLKGFVKIARWSDLNYWALKQSTEKTHRMVHKYSKKYQVILNQPITKLLGEKGDNLSLMKSGEELSKGGVLCDRLEVYRQTVYTQKLQHDKSEVDDITLSTLQQRLPILISKLSKHWKTVVKSLPYTQTLKGLDEFTGDVIETVHELQQAEINTGDDKEKQKSNAKFLNLRKRKSLAELFKYLTKMGLSYRKGLILDDQTKQDNSLSLQPLDITVAKSHYQLSEVLASQWENCQNYFYRCITRKTQLEQAVIQPAQDLGLGNVERCRGFSHHLHHLFTQQRHELGETFTSFLQIRKFTNEIKRLKKEDGYSLPSQSQVQYWLGRLKNLCIQLLEGLNQYNILLQSCPSPTTSTSILPDITQLSPLSNIKYGDTMWLQTSEKIQSIITRTESEYKKLMKISQKHFLLWGDVKLIEETSQRVKNFSETLTEISVLFTDPIDNTDCALNTPLNILIESISNCVGEVEEWVGQSKDTTDSGVESKEQTDKEVESSDMIDSGEESSEMIDSLIETVLLVVQKLLSKHPVVEKKTEEEEEEEEELEAGYVVKGLIENLKSDITEIKTKPISTMIKSIIEKTMFYFENKDTVINGETGIKLLLRCLPLLERYCDISEYFLAHIISSHRCCGKLLSVLLALFTELAMKGFCVPPELSDEMEQEGATEFKDIEQGGLGEGEGVKDVSDQIETEDQLDDTRRAGEEKKEDNNDHQDIPAEDNAIEMSEDFEGKPQDMKEEEDEDKDQNDDDEDDEDDIDKEMGDIDEKETDKLDEQLWGSDEEEDNESDEKPKDETGAGDAEKEESELAAKDDNLEKSQDKDKQNDKQQGEEEEKEEINEMEDIEEEGYNDDKIDTNQGDSKEPEQQPETMELPEDLNLDAEEAGEKEEETEMEDPAEGKEEENEDEEGTEDADKLKDKEEEEAEEDKEKDQESEKIEATEDGEEEEEKKEENGGEENKNNDNEEREDDEGQGDAGFTADDEKVEEVEEEEGKEEEKNDNIDGQAQTQHDDTNIENSDTAQDQANQADNDQQEKVGSGMADTQQDEGHEGEKSSEVTQGSNEKQKEMKRQPGKSREDRSLGAPDQSYQRLKTTEETHPEDEEEESGQEKKEGELYEHIKDSKSHHDAQTLDVANDDTEEQMIPNKDQEEVKDDDDEPMEDVKPLDDEGDDKEEQEEIEKKEADKVKGKKLASDKIEEMKIDQDEEMEEREKVEISGERILTMTANRGPASTIHTAVEHLHLDNGPSEIDVEKIRADLEENVSLWSHQSLTTPEQMAEASSAWQRYEAITSGLSQELCEQLRLILEPSQATKLKGDYRTGKRLNMRKVIPYIASQFRKDKIWLRRSKPSKRQYQIMLAIDDSSSMLDNHSKQLAFESLALISNALTLLEAGDLAVTSFGESVKVLHSFTDQFSSQSGVNILHQFTFEQKKTKIAQLLQQATSLMIDGRSRQHGIVGNPETSQLLLIVSDGRGLFSEGMEAVKSAVRKAREANIFLVFVIIDNPENKDSILDIRVPLFKGPGKLPEIKSYMEQFPFPFYIILRDINSLPITLSDALRQWFELVTAADR